MRVLVSGSSGLLGTAVRTGLEARGDAVSRLVRRDAGASDEIGWDPAAGRLDVADVSGFDAVVNLNGVSIGERRWTAGRKAAIRSSRVDVTSLLARTLAAAAQPPSVLVSASAVGFYGSRGNEVLDEDSSRGQEGDFLSGVVTDWEAAASHAADAGIRVVTPRTAVVLSGEGGILPRMALPFRLGGGGRIGDGEQWFSWIHVDDAVAAFLRLIDDPSLQGPVNLSAPEPVTNRELTATLGTVLRRPTFLPTPRLALVALYGSELVDALLYASARVVPERLRTAGFEFAHSRLEGALRAALGR